MSRWKQLFGTAGIILLLSLGACGRQNVQAPPERAPAAEEATQEVPASKTTKVPLPAAPETGGVGVALANQKDELVIHRILPDSPAALNKAIRVGDRVIAVEENGKSAADLTGKTVAEAVSLIRGPKGTTVRLTLVPAGRDAAQAHVVSLVRGELKALSSTGVPLKDLGWGDGVLLTPGSEAPDIEMAALPDKQTKRLTDFRGKVIVLTFWATWCAPCQKIMATLQTYPDAHPHWKDKVVLIAAGVDEDREALIKHLAAKRWDKIHHVHVGIDAIKAYHVGAVATQYVIDQRGKIIAADHALDVPRLVNDLLD